eukprot:CAMPEP_0206361742 /NCGR_PEP_ID=MMETSP0294-20121207/545_1 /ASSEMBLY_ACC=CAM_ASM_000327 /TAXON_ID=39354 /ORGANISM="Heterosigma akashiwo, Strain CCMP2393" /LENGTH=97 /DNA_ID=CAMNT_0053806689 /DNA_START=235 /DNA_END=525 /DNA_ORIENTATION=+
MTGFYRNGYCACGPGDYGVHSVCASLTEEFLAYTKGRGNDLSTPRPEFGFPGLKPGDGGACAPADGKRRWLRPQGGAGRDQQPHHGHRAPGGPAAPR